MNSRGQSTDPTRNCCVGIRLVPGILEVLSLCIRSTTRKESVVTKERQCVDDDHNESEKAREEQEEIDEAFNRQEIFGRHGRVKNRSKIVFRIRSKGM